NDNGGARTTDDFNLTANGTKPGNDLSGHSPVDGDATLKADTWTLSETGGAGYTASAWDCVGGTQNGHKITDRIAHPAPLTDTTPKPHTRNADLNDNGGARTTDDFTLTANGTKPGNDLSGHSPVDGDATLKADTWTLSETTLAGYDASAWVCVGGSQDGDKIT